ncbi:MAG: Hsp20/alpha crystallin family protein [Deltaproteobacteria bacterium]|nr:Hsp20/alpha crystallin family protein [Deltaproteobacteria bacterium]
MRNIAPWRKKEVSALREEIEDMFDCFFREHPVFGSSLPSNWTPSLDVSQTPEAVLVRAELPGMKAEDIDISLHDNFLTISGEKKRHEEAAEEDYHQTECFCGGFRRRIRLPFPVDADAVQAEYKNGILKVKLPKRQRTGSKTIAINVR